MDIRKNANALSDQEKKDFVGAVLALKKRQSVLHPDDATRSRYDDFVEVHLNAMNAMDATGSSWGHMGPAFGPWHRKLLRVIEVELQSIRAGVTIPYWDWTDPASTAAVFTANADDFFLGGDGDRAGRVRNGPFANLQDWTIRVKDSADVPDFLQRSFGRSNDAPQPPDANMVAASLQTTPYDTFPWNDMARDPNDPSVWGGFRIQLEVTLHNLVHRYIGGTMALAASPNDPVFWLHHANCDRLWAQWQDTNGMASYPTSGAPPGHNLSDVMIFGTPDAQPWPEVTKPSDTFDRYAMGYRYDTDPAVPAAPVTPPVPSVMAMRVTPRAKRRAVFPLSSEVPALALIASIRMPAKPPRKRSKAVPRKTKRNVPRRTPKPSRPRRRRHK